MRENPCDLILPSLKGNGLCTVPSLKLVAVPNLCKLPQASTGRKPATKLTSRDG